MTKQQKTSALLIGISLIIMAIAAGFAYGHVFNTLSTSNTLKDFQNNMSLFKIGNLAWILIIVTDLIVSIAVYYFFKPYHKNIAILSAGSRLIYTLILSLAFSFILRINLSTPYDEIMKNMETFELVWQWGLIIFGIHLVLLGLGHFSTDHLPNLLGLLLVIAGLSYMLTSGLHVIMPEKESLITLINNILMLPMVVGELGFGIYLMVKAKKSS